MKDEIKLNDQDSLQIKQILIDDERQTAKNGLLEEESRKHQVIEKVLDELKEEGIQAFIFADLPHPEVPVGIPTVYQFNTLQALSKYDKDGNMTNESSQEYIFFNSAMWKSFVDLAIMSSRVAKNEGLDKLSNKDPETHVKKRSLCSIISTVLSLHFMIWPMTFMKIQNDRSY